MTSRGRIKGLDVLRGTAIGLVLLCHSWTHLFPGAGIAGVTTFFALSGYLITGVLLRKIDTLGRVRYQRFFVHRLLRLYPALLAMLAGFVVVSLVFDLHPTVAAPDR